MKKSILLLLLVASFAANAQSLKDLLYSGKLKNDSGTTVRKGDDLSSKIDTAKKKPVEQPKVNLAVVPKDSVTAKTASPVPSDSATGAITTGTENTNAPVNTTATANNTTTNATKDNNAIWKQFIDSSISTWKTEVLPNKKVKSGTYYIFVEYEIGTDGQIGINNVSCSPESSFLQQQVKSTLTLSAPQMNPVLFSNGKPRKATKKYNFTLTKP
jgi:hypothetical protein